jgi:glycosyltransferase involved in cell wall biosynthesis
VTGRVVPPDDAACLAGAIRDLLGNQALRERMGRAARARAETEFGQERMVSSIQEAYTEVLARRVPAYQRTAIHAG